MSLTFVANATAPAGSPIHVTVYENGSPLDPVANPVTWTGLPGSMTVAPDATGYVFNDATVVAVSVTAHLGVALGSLLLSFTAPPLQFTAP